MKKNCLKVRDLKNPAILIDRICNLGISDVIKLKLPVSFLDHINVFSIQIRLSIEPVAHCSVVP